MENLEHQVALSHPSCLGDQTVIDAERIQPVLDQANRALAALHAASGQERVRLPEEAAHRLGELAVTIDRNRRFLEAIRGIVASGIGLTGETRAALWEHVGDRNFRPWVEALTSLCLVRATEPVARPGGALTQLPFDSALVEALRPSVVGDTARFRFLELTLTHGAVHRYTNIGQVRVPQPQDRDLYAQFYGQVSRTLEGHVPRMILMADPGRLSRTTLNRALTITGSVENLASRPGYARMHELHEQIRAAAGAPG